MGARRHAAAPLVEQFERRGGLDVLALSGLEGLDAVVTTRRGGASRAPYDGCNLGEHVGDDPAAVAANRALLATAMGVAPVALAIPHQVHGTGAVRVEHGDVAGDADVIGTEDPRVAVCVLVADCVPLLVCDAEAGVVALGHAGWRGTATNVAAATVALAVAMGADVERLAAYVGPRISGVAYQVGPEVAEALGRAGLTDAVVADGFGSYLADLGLANAAQLIGAGVLPARITVSSQVTDGGERFFSHRAHQPCGRFALAARLTPAAS